MNVKWIFNDFAIFASPKFSRSNISSGQILSCEYTVHPRWLADNNDAAALWPSNLPRPSSQDEMELVEDEVVIEEPAPIDFDRWCEEQETEETSNCNDIIFEQDIPASLEEEVITNSNEDTELDENSDNCSQTSQQTIEERSNRSPDDYVPNSINTCNSCAVDDDEKPMVKFKQTLLVNKTLLKLNQRTLTINPKAGTSILKSNILDKGVGPKVPVKSESVVVKSEPKFNQSLVIKRISPIAKYQKTTKFTIKKIKSRPFGGGKGKTGGKNAHNDSSGGGKTKKFVDLHGENITINHEADECVDTDIKPLIPPITIKKEQHFNDSESDIEVDIETEIPNDLIESQSQSSSSAIIPAIKPEPEPIELRKVPPLKIKTLKRKEFVQPTQADTTPISPALQEILDSLELPTEELVLSPQNITDLEKYFHPEFFVGRPTKTPERYLKIRDFIIHAWNDTKPAYVSKTTVRNGLKHCGDVNCISRIHCMLEQIGTINIGQSGEHFQYIRPLSKLKEHFMQSAQNNKKSQSSSGSNYDVTTLVMGRRQRNKSITFSSTTDKEIDANYTVSHVNGVPQLVYAAMPKERELPRREASKPLKIEFELIECLHFAKDKIPPFKISMSLSTLLCLYLHALSSKYEVMGFLGGFCSKSFGRTKLSLTRYKPTKTASQTGTTCEMCPGM